MTMKQKLIPFLLLLSIGLARPAAADEPGRYGSLWLGPRLGAGLGFAGPRGGWTAGVQLSYRTPYYFYYNLEVGFLHLLPKTVEVPEITEDEQVIAPAHEVDVTGLYGIPMTLEVGLRFAFGRARLRVGVGFGAMVSIQTAETNGVEETETIASFCFRPGVGVDIVNRSGAGMVMIDLMYIWQDASFEMTGNDRDVDSLLLTFGYTWQLAE